HTLLSSFSASGGKKGSAKKQSSQNSGVELGTDSADGVDYDWLPEHLKAELKRQSLMTRNGSATKTRKSNQSERSVSEPSKKSAITTSVRSAPKQSSARLRKI
ncbi:uncharacterized protein LOC108672479, partial [Hyalella azteca]|uniref:Uncharacterized protein LOC108672479 n=1 Tax=Hyalella azteca TaxID=294128 RepID=A0A8B7NPN1_HYAAZ